MNLQKSWKSLKLSASGRYRGWCVPRGHIWPASAPPARCSPVPRSCSWSPARSWLSGAGPRSPRSPSPGEVVVSPRRPRSSAPGAALAAAPAGVRRRCVRRPAQAGPPRGRTPLRDRAAGGLGHGPDSRPRRAIGPPASTSVPVGTRRPGRVRRPAPARALRRRRRPRRPITGAAGDSRRSGRRRTRSARVVSSTGQRASARPSSRPTNTAAGVGRTGQPAGRRRGQQRVGSGAAKTVTGVTNALGALVSGLGTAACRS